jgi:prolyl-tRNA editing enzyme YbaK/EbsC (Cys-tRNA(Pro) deacylase)
MPERPAIPSDADPGGLRPLGLDDLQAFIDANAIAATILPLGRHTPTVADAAQALAVETDQIIKSLVFMVNGAPLLVINNGLARVDKKKLAGHLGVGRKRVTFASPEQALAISGFVVGSMPPFGHRQRMQTIVDPMVAELETVYGGGGGIDAMMRVTTVELLRVTEAALVAISE